MNNQKFCPLQVCVRKTPPDQLCEACKAHRKLLRQRHYEKLRNDPKRTEGYKLRKRKEYYVSRPAKLAVAAKSRRGGARFTNVKRMAHKRGLDFLLTKEEFQTLVEKPCHYCGDVFNARALTCAGLDRIDNTKGYEPSNVLPCCTACNRLRGEHFSVEEAKIAVSAIIAYRRSFPPTTS